MANKLIAELPETEFDNSMILSPAAVAKNYYVLVRSSRDGRDYKMNLQKFLTSWLEEINNDDWKDDSQ